MAQYQGEDAKNLGQLAALVRRQPSWSAQGGRAGCPRFSTLPSGGYRWAVEDSSETAENELGLDHNETRSWHSWHWHVSLVMLACAMMASIRHRANQPAS